MNILLISAHPDDVEIGMGGTAAKLAQNGAMLTSLILTDGRRSANPFGLSPDALANTRQKEAVRAADILGIQDVRFGSLPDLKSAGNYHLAAGFVGEVLQEIRPAEVYVLHPLLDRHASHQLAGKVAIESIRDANVHPVVWAYEVWGLFHQWDRFEDISSFTGKKLQAISEHKSQVACVPYGEGVLGLNRWRAIFADPQQESTQSAFAEVFVRISPDMEL